VFKLTPGALHWSHRVLYNFCRLSKCIDGAGPHGSLLMDSAGNLYGTTLWGGKNTAANSGQGGGTVFGLSPTAGAWKETVLHAFCSASGCGDGEMPFEALIMDKAGNLYGSTRYGGINSGAGIVFEMSQSAAGWNETVLHNFCASGNCTEGATIISNLIFDGGGNLYGAALQGGPTGNGTVFELSPAAGAWNVNVLYSFCPTSGCADGSQPVFGLTFGSAGQIYGTAQQGGRNNAGVVFQLNKSSGRWDETVLQDFCVLKSCADGSFPATGVITDAAGNLFGVTTRNGRTGDYGTIFKLTPGSPRWSRTILHYFCSLKNCADGHTVWGNLLMDSAGNLYGTASGGGKYGGGLVFELQK